MITPLIIAATFCRPNDLTPRVALVAAVSCGKKLGIMDEAAAAQNRCVSVLLRLYNLGELGHHSLFKGSYKSASGIKLAQRVNAPTMGQSLM